MDPQTESNLHCMHMPTCTLCWIPAHLLFFCIVILDVEMISKFAQMEFKFGEPERGKTMFENILSTYPKRTDLWSIYIDMVTKLKEIDGVR